MNDNINENVVEDITTNSTIKNVETLNTTDLEAIHYDLGIITAILIFFVLVILLRYAYKFWDIFF